MPDSRQNEMIQSPRVNIRPGVGILSVLRHLNYKPWFAMAEFVDNSLQSYLQNRDALRCVHGDAFRPAELPPETAGLAEFGMGMKSAACWFAPRWKVRTSALGEGVERTISFDIATIVRDDIALREKARVAGRRTANSRSAE